MSNVIGSGELDRRRKFSVMKSGLIAAHEALLEEEDEGTMELVLLFEERKSVRGRLAFLDDRIAELKGEIDWR
jgi:hypothetical protein